MRLRAARTGRVGARFESRLLWIFGSPRSGSTWLLQLLAEHPAVVPVNEPQIGLYLGPFLSDLPGFVASELEADNFTLRRLQASERSHFFSDESRGVWLPLLRRLLRGRFFAYAAMHPADTPPSRSLFAIKEPSGSQSADVIMAALPLRARVCCSSFETAGTSSTPSSPPTSRVRGSRRSSRAHAAWKRETAWSSSSRAPRSGCGEPRLCSRRFGPIPGPGDSSGTRSSGVIPSLTSGRCSTGSACVSPRRSSGRGSVDTPSTRFRTKRAGHAGSFERHNRGCGART